MFIVFTSFKHPKLPISIKIPVTLLQWFIFAWQLHVYREIRAHELPLCKPASCVVVLDKRTLLFRLYPPKHIYT